MEASQRVRRRERVAYREERELSIGSKLRRTSQSSMDSCCPHWTGVCGGVFLCVCVCV